MKLIADNLAFVADPTVRSIFFPDMKDSVLER